MKWVVSKGRVVEELYDENLEVNVAMDLGMNDTFTLVYFQRWKGEWRIVNEYANHSEPLAHYVNHMRDTGYRIGVVVCPHDIRVRELSNGKSREHTLRELGVTNIKVLVKSSVAEGIEITRQTLRDTWVDPCCEYVIKCLKNYSKEWDERTQTWKAKPSHDQWSHGADAIRYMAMSQVSRTGKEGKSRAVAKGFAV